MLRKWDLSLESLSFLFTVNKPSFSSVAVRQIKPDELKYQHPKKPFKTTASCELYKGEYQGFPVAIKRYLDPMNTSARSVPQFSPILGRNTGK